MGVLEETHIITQAESRTFILLFRRISMKQKILRFTKCILFEEGEAVKFGLVKIDYVSFAILVGLFHILYKKYFK